MRKEYLITTALIVLVWFFCANNIANDIILPSPIMVLDSLKDIIVSGKFLAIIFVTIKRVLIGYSLSFVVAFIFAIISDYSIKFKLYFRPIEEIMKSVPNISYIILALIWLGQEKSVILVIFLVAFPILYPIILDSLKYKTRDMEDCARVFSKSYTDALLCVKLPLAIPTILLGFNASLALSFKVGVMAEILNQTPNGIGYQLYLSKVNLNMNDLFAWTIVIIGLTMVVYFIIKQIVEIVQRNYA